MAEFCATISRSARRVANHVVPGQSTVHTMKRQTLVVMVKEPRPGRVKTRLAGEIGTISAAWWFRHQVSALLREVQHPGWTLVLAVTPDSEGLTSRVWPAHLPRIPQGSGNLGDRMRRIFRSLRSGPVCIIGGDIPDIRSKHIAAAFNALGSNEVVFGPAFDGGYWLIGLKQVRPPPRELFEDVHWSTKHALADSEATLKDFSIAHVNRLRDIDTAADLYRLGHDGPE